MCALTRTAAGTLVALALLAGSAGPAAAHAQLLDSTPGAGERFESAPDQVELVFNEPVQLPDDALRLFVVGDAEPRSLTGRAVDARVSAPLPSGLGAGGYVVAYRVISADGHPVSGTIAFTVGDAAPTPGRVDTGELPAPTPALAALSALVGGGAVLCAGLAFFDVVIRRNAVRLRLTRRLTAAGWLVALLASIGLIGANLWLPGGTGRIDPHALLALGFIAVAGIALRSRGLARVVLAALALLGPLVVGHSASIEPVGLTLFVDAVHLAAAAYWVGGIAGLSILLTAPRTRALTPADGADDSVGRDAEILSVQRFSTGAAVSVLALLVSGATLAVLILPSPDAFVTSAFGRTLLVKVALVLAVVALAAVNRFGILPRVRRSGSIGRSRRMLRTTVALEAGLLALIVAVTGLLTVSDPTPSRTEAVPVEISSPNLQVRGTLDPLSVGRSVLRVQLERGGVRTDAEEVTVTATLPEVGLGPIVTEAQRDPVTGDYVAELELPVPGTWTLVLAARWDSYDKPAVQWDVEVP